MDHTPTCTESGHDSQDQTHTKFSTQTFHSSSSFQAWNKWVIQVLWPHCRWWFSWPWRWWFACKSSFRWRRLVYWDRHRMRLWSRWMKFGRFRAVEVRRWLVRYRLRSWWFPCFGRSSMRRARCRMTCRLSLLQGFYWLPFQSSFQESC